MTRPPKKPVNTGPMTYDEQVKIARALPRIARILRTELTKAAGRPVLFSLWTWGDGRSQYISNAQRDDIKKALQETLDRWDDVDPPPGSKEWN